jgi:hypothetical protein
LRPATPWTSSSSNNEVFTPYLCTTATAPGTARWSCAKKPGYAEGDPVPAQLSVRSGGRPPGYGMTLSGFSGILADDPQIKYFTLPNETNPIYWVVAWRRDDISETALNFINMIP